MQAIRKAILSKLIHTQPLSFNQLWAKEGESNTFAYHLKALEENGFLEKTQEGYYLTLKGKKYAARAEGTTGEISQPPIIVVIIVVCHEDKILMQCRTKEPFANYWGFPAGKIKASQYILEAAQEELFEETGLACSLELKGLFSSKTFVQETLAYNHQIFVVKGTQKKGTLLEQTREGKNAWKTVQEIKELKTFPNIQKTLDIVFSSGFKWVEADRFQENDQFVGMKVLREEGF